MALEFESLEKVHLFEPDIFGEFVALKIELITYTLVIFKMLKNSDALFQKPSFSAIVRDNGEVSEFETSVFVFSPGLATFAKLMDLAEHKKGKFDSQLPFYLEKY